MSEKTARHRPRSCRARQRHPGRRRELRPIKKRFGKINLASSEDSRRDYREMLFRASEGMRNYVSGVHPLRRDDRQKAKDGTTLVDIMKAAGSIPGIRSTSAPSRSPDRL